MDDGSNMESGGRSVSKWKGIGNSVWVICERFDLQESLRDGALIGQSALSQRESDTIFRPLFSLSLINKPTSTTRENKT